MNNLEDRWNDGDPYEYFMGRWSKLMATQFLNWLNLPYNLIWLDVGCGTGVLGEAIYKFSNPKKLFCLDPSEGYLGKAKSRLDGKGDFILGDVSELPFENDAFDIIVSGLALNFFLDLELALSEMN